MGPKHNNQLNPSKSTDRKHGKPHVHQSTPQTSEQILPLELQQEILNAFNSAFPLAGEGNIAGIIQEVKGHLYNRDFIRAFSTQDYLDAYALRWSASRALAYTDVFAALGVHIWSQAEGMISPTSAATVDDPTTHAPKNPNQPPPAAKGSRPGASKVVCIGGGAGAEVAALAALSRHHSLPPMTIAAVDIADWSQSLSKLQHSLKTAPTLSVYAGEAAKSANRALVPDEDQLHVGFTQQDILACEGDEMQSLLVGVRLVTLMFTLNELFTASITRTTALLLALGDAMEVGAWLLVVDSPGSYSEVKLGKDGGLKRYPMQWLLDHTLQKVAGEDMGGHGKWRKVVGEESRWFRIRKELKYPIELENMRYQIHLFQRQ